MPRTLPRLQNLPAPPRPTPQGLLTCFRGGRRWQARPLFAEAQRAGSASPTLSEVPQLRGTPEFLASLPSGSASLLQPEPPHPSMHCTLDSLLKARSGVSTGRAARRGRPLARRGPPWSTFCPCPQKAPLPAGRQGGRVDGHGGAAGPQVCLCLQVTGRPPAPAREAPAGAFLLPSTGQGARELRRPLVSSRKRPWARGRHFRPWTGARRAHDRGPTGELPSASSVNQTHQTARPAARRAEPLQHPPPPAEGAPHAQQPCCPLPAPPVRCAGGQPASLEEKASVPPREGLRATSSQASQARALCLPGPPRRSSPLASLGPTPSAQATATPPVALSTRKPQRRRSTGPRRVSGRRHGQLRHPRHPRRRRHPPRGLWDLSGRLAQQHGARPP